MRGSNYHLTLLAQNKIGFKNLIKLASAAYLEGFYFKAEGLASFHECFIDVGKRPISVCFRFAGS